MRKLFFVCLILATGLLSCEVDQIETQTTQESFTLQTDQISNADTQSDSRSPGIVPGSSPNSRLGCIMLAPCESYGIPVETAGPDYLPLHIWYSSDLRESEIHCIRIAYFRCFQGELWMNDTQPSDPYHDIWLVEAGKPDNGLNSTTVDDPRVCNNPTNSCD